MCGRFVGVDGRIVAGAAVEDPDTRTGLREPLTGSTLQDPGPYALALKPHTIDLIDFRCVVAHRERLLEALDELPASVPIDRSGLLATRKLRSKGWRVVYSPLLEALGTDDPTKVIMPSERLARATSGLGRFFAAKSQFV